MGLCLCWRWGCACACGAGRVSCRVVSCLLCCCLSEQGLPPEYDPLGVRRTKKKKLLGPFTLTLTFTFTFTFTFICTAKKAAPGLDGTRCHRHPGTTDLSGLRFSAMRAVGRERQRAFPGQRAESWLLPAFWLRNSLAGACPSAGSSAPIHASVPSACRVAMRPRVFAVAMHRAKGPSTSPCSAPRSFGIGGSPSGSTWDRFRCFIKSCRR